MRFCVSWRNLLSCASVDLYLKPTKGCWRKLRPFTVYHNLVIALAEQLRMKREMKSLLFIHRQRYFLPSCSALRYCLLARFVVHSIPLPSVIAHQFNFPVCSSKAYFSQSLTQSERQLVNKRTIRLSSHTNVRSSN